MMAVSVRCHGIFCDCSRTTQVAFRGKFIQTLTVKSIAIQNMRVQRYDWAVNDDNGWKELVNLRNRKTLIKHFINGPDKCIYVSLVLLLA